MKKVLVLDANQRSSLAVTRSLGTQGIPLVTADDTPSALAGCSRYSTRHFNYHSPRTEPGRFMADVVSLCNTQRIDLILPMTELTSMLLLENREQIPDVLIPFPEPDVIDSVADKCLLMQLARKLDVPVPRTWFIDQKDRLPFDLEELPYPVVMKPCKSWLLHNGCWIRTSARFVRNFVQARHVLKSDAPFQTFPFMIQECISGHGEGIFTLYDHGNPVAWFAHRRLREKPPRGGVSVLSESIRVDPVLLSHARKLLEKAGWHGVAMVEFKVTREGAPFLMEINTRFWGSLQLAIDAGVDFPLLLYRLACDEQPASVDNYITGKRLRWLLGDLDSLYLTFRDKSFTTGEKLKALYRFLTPAPLTTRHEVNRWRDMGPFWCEMKQYFRDISGTG